MRKTIFLTVGYLFLLGAGLPEVKAEAEFTHYYTDYRDLLMKYLKYEGRQTLMDYKSLKENKKDLEKVIKNFEAVTKVQYENFSDKEKLAFLINTYNLFTIKLIVDAYPVKSIKDAGKFFSGPWSKKFVTILGSKFSLDHIEHEMIRKKFKEPRIHFAVNCASLGCPSLEQSPYRPSNIDEQLEHAEMFFLTDTDENYFDKENNILYLSKIFKWYGSDWWNMTGKRYIKTIEKYFPEIKDKEYKIEFKDYDWSLNVYKGDSKNLTRDLDKEKNAK